MKERFNALRARIDARALRERVMIFAASAAVIVFVLYAAVLGPQLKRQAALKAQIAQERDNIAGIDAEITARVQSYAIDPDQDSRVHLAKVDSDVNALSARLRAMQNGLIAPEGVAPMLETMLKANGRLKLVALKSLPMTVMQAGGAPAAAAGGTSPPAGGVPADLKNLQPGLAAMVAPAVNAAPGVQPGPSGAQALAVLYRHGVQLTVRGNYLDMVDYLATLEAMPSRLFWGPVELEVETYPDSRLTLTVYTLSLDQKWMKL